MTFDYTLLSSYTSLYCIPYIILVEDFHSLIVGTKNIDLQLLLKLQYILHVPKFLKI